MKLFQLHEITMKVSCTKCKKIMNSQQAATQVPTQGIKDTVVPNICDQCANKNTPSTLPPALGDLAGGGVGPNAAAEKLNQAPANFTNKFRRPPTLSTNTQFV